MEYQTAVCAAILIDNDKGWAGHRIDRAPALRETLNECSFPRAEVSLQTDHIARSKQTAQPHSDAACLLRAAAEKFNGV